MTGSVVVKTLHCDFVRNSAFTGQLILQDSFQADVDYLLAGFHFSTAIFNRSVISTGAWLIVNDAKILDFANTAGIRALASQCLVRSSALGVNSYAHRSEWVSVKDRFMLRSGQKIGLYAFSSNLNTQRTFATIALHLIRADQLAA
jgi:hypothetical protein